LTGHVGPVVSRHATGPTFLTSPPVASPDQTAPLPATGQGGRPHKHHTKPQLLIRAEQVKPGSQASPQSRPAGVAAYPWLAVSRARLTRVRTARVRSFTLYTGHKRPDFGSFLWM